MLKADAACTSEWQLQTAKAQFSQVVKLAVEVGPQLVTKSGVPAVYVVDAEAFEAEFASGALGRKRVLVASPHRDIALDLTRDRSEGREVDL